MPSKKKQGRNFFTDIWRKVVALVLAVFAWFTIHKQVESHAQAFDVKVPLQIECSNDGVILPENAVEVTLTIRNSLFASRISPNDFVVKYIVQDTVSTIPEKGKIVKLYSDRDIKISRKPILTEVFFDANKSNTSFFIDKSSIKNVPVEVRHKGKMAYGKVPQFSASPEFVQIEGPSTKLAEIHQAFTEEIDITGLSRDGHFEAELAPFEKGVKIVQGPVNSAIRIEAKALNARQMQLCRLEGKLPVGVLHSSPQRLKIVNDKPYEVNLTFETDAETFAEIRKLKLRPYMDISSIDRESKGIEVPVQLDLPKSISERVLHVKKEPEAFILDLELPGNDAKGTAEGGNGN